MSIITKIPSMYPIFLPTIGQNRSVWLNLAYIVNFRYWKETDQYEVLFHDGSLKYIPKQWGELIENEFRLLEAARSFSPDETD